MKRVACAAVLAACVSVFGSAFAADLSLKDTPGYEVLPETIWTGLYLGGHIGGSWGDSDISDTYEYNSYDPHTNTTISTNDLLYGAQIGYNIQRNNLVYGLEADIGQMTLDGSKSAHLLDEGKDDGSKYGNNDWDCDGGGHQKCELDAKYTISSGLYGDITGRIGYASNKALFYVKGGAAFLNVDMNAQYTGQHVKGDVDPDTSSTFDYSKSETMWGWTIGAGVEYAISRSLSLKAEYQHFDFGTMDMSYNGKSVHWCGGQKDLSKCPGYSTLSGDSETDVTVDAVSVGVNYHFNGGADPLK